MKTLTLTKLFQNEMKYLLQNKKIKVKETKDILLERLDSWCNRTRSRGSLVNLWFEFSKRKIGSLFVEAFVLLPIQPTAATYDSMMTTIRSTVMLSPLARHCQGQPEDKFSITLIYASTNN
ncbi:hypothetical protein T07_11759 [Trichinella nelsoni]|uniref:Uncharacterized protein n=1 Tax=Trichinella nelsoni TaxID=6336 RepID=A0A0V0SCV2_9BILA|nr:hypothetical protein T07_11759 [Trichinella nelsoni]